MRILGVVLVSLAALPAARAQKSNQVRPTPSPISNPALKPGDIVLAPEVVYARYTDSLDVPQLPNVSQDYDINSLGLIVEAQIGILEWFSTDITAEGYRKFGTIRGPSPGQPTMLTEASVLGWAFKFGAQLNARLYRRGDADVGAQPEMGDFSIYVFAKGLGDFFWQDQVEPLFTTEFSENAFTYRGGAAGHLYAGGGFFLAAFGGVEGLTYGGERIDRPENGPETTEDIAGGEVPYPFFGFDVLWAPAILGTDYSHAISLAAILALATEDDAGFGGELLTLSIGYAFEL